ncbi:acyl-CoA thioesterase-1 [Mesorhizobium sp. J18]|uniref:arylesterase n=1 Tax=Mesorhizobium sp. J18 TaxID=935263 RepID=UPI00119C2C2F|nr:arylesterase [Mesorhizobium sp. J18]TWG97906.1 acyl-CoA thioesterase-1 [Mesorhizobium sp. J18]
MAFKHLARLFFATTLTFLSVFAAFAEPVRIVGFGDSLMAGYQLAPGESFPEKLQEALHEKGYDIEVANAGVSGDTTSGGLSRLDWSVPDGTDVVILELGANDMLRGVSPKVVEENLAEMIEKLQARGIRILLVGMMAAPNLGADYAEAFNAIYPRLAEKYDVPLHPFFLDGVAANAAMQLQDGMHPNAEGVNIMVERILPVMEEMLSKEKTDA